MSRRERQEEVVLQRADETPAAVPVKHVAAASSVRQRILQRLRDSIDVSILIPLILALGMLGYVTYLAAARHSGDQIWVIIQHSWLVVLLLTFPYLAARALVWYRLLCQLGIGVPWRQLVFAFAAGEMTKSLPAGVYVQNYLLGRLRHLGQVSLARSTMATTAMLGLEAVVAVPVALLIGISGAPWVRVALLAIVVTWIIVLILAWLLVHYRAKHMSPRAAVWRRRIVLFIEEVLVAGGDLISFRTIRSLIPTVIYMLIYSVDLFVILQAAGVHRVSFVDALGISAVLVLAVILVPIPTEIGITEFTGLGALLAYGVDSSIAAAVMLAFRILTTGATILIGAILIVLMRDELRSSESGSDDGFDDGFVVENRVRDERVRDRGEPVLGGNELNGGKDCS